MISLNSTLRRGCGHIAIASALCALFGCRGESEVAPTSGVVASPNPVVTSENLESVPGTAVPAPADDASADGWHTELFSATALAQLDNLAKHLTGSDTEPTSPIADLVTSDFTGQSLRPTQIKEAYRDDAIVVRRGQHLDSAARMGADGLIYALKELLSFVTKPHDVHTKFKVFRVSQNGNDARTSAYVQIWGACLEGSFQINSVWRCQWQLAEPTGPPLLAAIKPTEYEEVIGYREQGGQPFADCTAAILADETFQQQLLPGIDHWLGSIEMRMGIDIGGWQGLAIADANGDGLEDLYICQPGGLPNRLYLQTADGTCQETSASAGIDWLDSTHGALFVDLDNDADQDLIVGLKDGIVIMANNGQGQFAPRAAKILPAALPYSLAAADYDADGDLDIFVCCYNRRKGVNRHLLFARPVPYHDAQNGGRNVLLRNDATPKEAAWQFRYVTKDVGLDENNRRFSYAAAWEDYDNDGDLDLYVANDFGRNNLYQNEGGRFHDVADQAGVEDISPGMSACWGDYNNDGFIDLYVSNMFSSAGNRIAFQQRFQQNADESTRGSFQRHARGNSLFENRGDGSFRDVSVPANVVLGRWAWGSKFVDLNNDGWQDLLVANGFITQEDTGDL